MTVTCAGIDADHVAGCELEIFKRQCVRAIGALCSGLVKQADLAFRAAIYRIMNMNVVQSEFSGSLDAYRDFLNGTCAVIATRPVDGNLWGLRLVCGNEVILRQPNRLAFIHCS